MVKTVTLRRFQEDLINGMSIEAACHKHKVSLAYAFEHISKGVGRPPKPKHRRVKTRKKPGRKKKGKSYTGEPHIQKRDGKFYLRCHVNGKQKCFGTYSTLEDAIKVRTPCMEHGWKKRKIDEYCETLGVERCKGTKRSRRMFH